MARWHWLTMMATAAVLIGIMIMMMRLQRHRHRHRLRVTASASISQSAASPSSEESMNCSVDDAIVNMIQHDVDDHDVVASEYSSLSPSPDRLSNDAGLHNDDNDDDDDAVKDIIIVSTESLIQSSQRSAKHDHDDDGHDRSDSSSSSSSYSGAVCVGPLIVHTHQRLAEGSKGTFVFSGLLNGRAVAVKRMLSKCSKDVKRSAY